MAVAASFVLVGVTFSLSQQELYSLAQVSLLTPALATFALVPGSGRTWYWWAAIAALANVIYPEVLPIFLIAAYTFALHHAWVTVRAGAPIRGARLVPHIRTRTARTATRAKD